ncbi:MAG: acetyltransferase [Clostridium sp.]|nr:acetyltransferase [Clostridium sp.]
MEPIILIGGGGHAGSVADSIIQSGRYEIAGFVDRESGRERGPFGIPLLGTDRDLEALFASGIRNAAVTVGYLGKGDLRERLYALLKRIGYRLPVIRDPSSVLAEGVCAGEGTYIGKRAVINTNARVGRMCIINTGAIVEHDNQAGDFTHVAVGAVLCGAVRTGKGVLIGANAVVLQGVCIGDYAVAGAGVTVRRDLLPGETYYGAGNEM